MKGATAEPCVNTIKPPMSVIIMIMGKSQYFFLTRMKVHNSKKKDMQYHS